MVGVTTKKKLALQEGLPGKTGTTVNLNPFSLSKPRFICPKRVLFVQHVFVQKSFVCPKRVLFFQIEGKVMTFR